MKRSPKAYELVVSGKVQGVFFRAGAARVASQLEIKGWTLNEADGSVRVWAEGAEDNLTEFIAWVRQGPEFARVDELKIQEKIAQGFNKFEIRR